MHLTLKQETFCQAIGDGMNKLAAYRLAYNADGMKDSVTSVEASKLLKNPKVARRLTEMKSLLAEKVLWTREESVNSLKDVIKNPSRASDVVAAVKELNAMHGFNAAQKIELSGEIKSIQVAYED